MCKKFSGTTINYLYDLWSYTSRGDDLIQQRNPTIIELYITNALKDELVIRHVYKTLVVNLIMIQLHYLHLNTV